MKVPFVLQFESGQTWIVICNKRDLHYILNNAPYMGCSAMVNRIIIDKSLKDDPNLKDIYAAIIPCLQQGKQVEWLGPTELYDELKNAGLTQQETEILDILTFLWDRLVGLKIEHPDDIPDARNLIHQLQARIMMRPVRRQLNKEAGL